jgi:hypothetical protein
MKQVLKRLLTADVVSAVLGGKRREALGVDHKRLLYCVNVNRTSLDHLLLGESADIDELSNNPSITPGEKAGFIFFGS